MTSKLVVNTIEADTGISSVSFASSISMSSTSKFHFGNAGIDIGADTNINRPASGVLAFNINSSEKVRIDSNGKVGIATDTGNGLINTRHAGTNQQVLHVRADLGSSNNRSLNLYTPDTDNTQAPFRFQTGNGYLFQCDSEDVFTISHDRKIGIGTNAPSAKLEVQDRSGGTLIGLSVGTQYGNASFGGYNNYPAIMNSSSQPLIYCDTNNDRTVFFGDTVGFGTTCAFRVNGAERLRIHSNGNLTQTGSGNVVHYINTGNNSGDNSTIAFGDSADADAGHINYDHGTNAFQIRTNGASNSVVITNEGEMQLSGDANPVLSVNRGGSNTTNINIKYNGSTRSQLSAASNGFEISAVGSTAPIQFFTNGSERLRITNGGLDPSTDAVTDLGNSSKRFRDLYLSSGIFLGGTTSSNELEDYEQGDITLTLVGTSGGSANYSYRTGHYTKIGNICHVTGDIRFNGAWSGSTGSLNLNLPFVSEASGGCVGAGIVSEWNLSGSNWDNIMIKVDNNESYARFTAHSGNNNNTSNFQTNLFGNGRYLKFAFTYQTQ